jgi:TusA-related sulfurtransferase
MAVKEIDITKEHCPMTFVKVKLALAQIVTGDTLSVLLSSGEPLENVPDSAIEAGHHIESIQEEPPFHRVLIKKG